MKLKIDDKAVVELLSAILLMAMAVSVFSVVYMNVLADPGPDPNAFLKIIGRVDDNDDVIFDHTLGQQISIDSPLTLTIGGQDIEEVEGEPLDTVSDLLSDEFKEDGVWSISEYLLYHPTMDLTDVEIKANIYDKESNSMVFWGTLQDGYVAPPYGRGGLWHFDEPFWTGAYREVKDSSGNKNHGTSRYDAKIIVEDNDPFTDDTISRNCGYFDGINDKVEVKKHHSLNITNQITVEAWVKPLEEKTIISDIILDSLKFGFNPDIIHIYKDTYAITARDTGGTGANKPCVVFTFNVTEDGTISTLDPSIPNNRTHFCEKGDKPDIIQHAENNSLYLIVYQNATRLDAGAVCTVQISDNGSVTKPVGSGFNEIFSDVDECYDPMIIHVSNDIYTIVYHSGAENKPGQGKIVTISVDLQGRITKKIDYTFNTNGCTKPNIVHVSGDIYAISYQSISTSKKRVGVITTLNISSDGNSITQINDFIFSTHFCKMPYLIRVSGDIYAIAYQGTDGNPGAGVLTTINITNDGSIISKIDDFTFTDACYEATITHAKDNRYFLIYTDSESESSKAYIRTVEIQNDGVIIDAAEPWEPEYLTEPLSCPSDVLHVKGRVFVYAFKGVAAQHGHPGHIMSLLIGQDPTPAHLRGIVRAGAATIYGQYNRATNMVDIFGCINGPDQLIIAEVNPDVWYHLVLTYDRSNIRLYAGSLGYPISLIGEKPYDKKVNIPNNNFLFGNVFYGYLDEIAIFDHALSFEEIAIHHSSPGIFE
jgi:hypothetical protein